MAEQKPIAASQKTPEDSPVAAGADHAEPHDHKKRSILPVGIVVGIFILLILVLAVYLILPKQSQSTQVKVYPGKIIISYSAWPGYIGLVMAREKGYFKEAGLNVELKTYPSLADESKDYRAYKIQARLNLNLEAVKEGSEGFQHQAVLVIDNSNGADGIIAQPGITDMSQLKGKKVAYEFGTLEEFLLSHALSEYNLTVKDVTGVDVNPEDAAKAIADKKVDAAVTYEPFLSTALDKIHGNKIYTSADAPGLIADILTFNKKFIDENPDTIEALLRAYFKGLNFAKQNPQEAYKILAKVNETTPEDIATQLKGIKVFSLEDNKTAFTFSPGLQSLYGNLRSINQFVSEKKQQSNGAGSKEIDTDTLINGTFIKKISN